jgi:hypothetical protein
MHALPTSFNDEGFAVGASALPRGEQKLRPFMPTTSVFRVTQPSCTSFPALFAGVGTLFLNPRPVNSELYISATSIQQVASPVFCSSVALDSTVLQRKIENLVYAFGPGKSTFAMWRKGQTIPDTATTYAVTLGQSLGYAGRLTPTLSSTTLERSSCNRVMQCSEKKQ